MSELAKREKRRVFASFFFTLGRLKKYDLFSHIFSDVVINIPQKLKAMKIIKLLSGM